MGHDILMTEGKDINDQIAIPLAHIPLVKANMALGRVVIFLLEGEQRLTGNNNIFYHIRVKGKE